MHAVQRRASKLGFNKQANEIKWECPTKSVVHVEATIKKWLQQRQSSAKNITTFRKHADQSAILLYTEKNSNGMWHMFDTSQLQPQRAHDLIENPWQTVASALFTWRSENYNVICAYLSRYFETERLHYITTTAVIHKMKVVFARHGIPKKKWVTMGHVTIPDNFVSLQRSGAFSTLLQAHVVPRAMV